MVKQLKRAASFILALVLLMSLLTVSAWAEIDKGPDKGAGTEPDAASGDSPDADSEAKPGAGPEKGSGSGSGDNSGLVWHSTTVEQYSARVPQIDLYFYPLDENGEIISGLNGNNTQIAATLDGEPVEVVELGAARALGTSYIVAVNVSAQDTGFGYLESVKASLAAWIEKMGENDRFLLIAYTDKPALLMDGTETRLAASSGLSALKTDIAPTDPVAAVELAIDVSATLPEDFPDRRVLIMFDDGAFASDNQVVIKNLLSSLKSANLPLYAVCHNSRFEEGFLNLAVDSGGAEILTNIYSCEDEAVILRSYIESGYFMRLQAPNNRLKPTDRLLELEMVSGGMGNAFSVDIAVHENIPDTLAPTLLSWKMEDEDSISLRFSERVSGADDVDSYSLTGEKDEEIEIASVHYDALSASVQLELAEALPEGDYELALSGIRDDSEEGNPLQMPEGVDSVEIVSKAGEKKDEDDNTVLIVAVAAVVLVAVIALVLIMRSKRQKAEAERLRSEQELLAQQAMNPDMGMPMGGFNGFGGADCAPAPNPGYSPIVEERAMDLLVNLSVVMPNGLKNRYSITLNSSYTVGRKAERCNLAINDEKISSRHFSLSVSNGKLLLSDLGSTNGTWLNGVRIDRPRPLQSGDTIIAGGTRISVEF